MKNKTKKKTDFRVLLPVCIVLPLLAIVAGGLIFSLVTGGPEPVGEEYLTLMTAKDADGILEMYHGGMLSYLQDNGGETMTRVAARFRERLDTWYDKSFASCGENVTFTYELAGKESVDEETLEELREILGDGVSKAVVFEGTVTGSGSAGSNTVTHWVQLVKVDGSWYLYNLQMLV